MRWKQLFELAQKAETFWIAVGYPKTHDALEAETFWIAVGYPKTHDAVSLIAKAIKEAARDILDSPWLVYVAPFSF